MPSDSKVGTALASVAGSVVPLPGVGLGLGVGVGVGLATVLLTVTPRCVVEARPRSSVAFATSWYEPFATAVVSYEPAYGAAVLAPIKVCLPSCSRKNSTFDTAPLSVALAA